MGRPRRPPRHESATRARLARPRRRSARRRAEPPACSRGDRAVPRSGYEIVRSALLDPETALDVVPLDTRAWRHFEALPASISDSTDGLIVSTAQAPGVPLVTKYGRITAARVVEVIWYSGSLSDLITLMPRPALAHTARSDDCPGWQLRQGHLLDKGSTPTIGPTCAPPPTTRPAGCSPVAAPANPCEPRPSPARSTNSASRPPRAAVPPAASLSSKTRARGRPSPRLPRQDRQPTRHRDHGTWSGAATRGEPCPATAFLPGGGVRPVAGWAQVDRGRVAADVELREPVRAASQPPHFIGEPVGDGEAACT